MESNIIHNLKYNLWSLEKWVEAFLPMRCAACSEPSYFKKICNFCEKLIEPAQNNTNNPDDIVAFFSYEGPVRQIIREAKFGRNETKAKALIHYWNQKTSKESILAISKICPFDTICFVPIHWRRRIWRGFDLSAIFAKVISRKLKMPLRDLLISKQFNKPLTLSQNKSERERIIKNRFELKKSIFTSLNILLVDDVVTTGTTLNTAEQVLKNDGHNITKIALAKANKKVQL